MVLRTALRKEKTGENVPRPRTLLMLAARDRGRARLGSRTRAQRRPGKCTTRRKVAGCSRPKGFVRIADNPTGTRKSHLRRARMSNSGLSNRRARSLPKKMTLSAPPHFLSVQSSEERFKPLDQV